MTTGTSNTAVGTSTALSVTTGHSNVAIGTESLFINTTGSANIAVGKDALRNNSTASNNTAIGHNALYANTTGTQNVAVGYAALDALTTGNNCTAVGYSALTSATGQHNTAVGESAGNNITTGYNNTVMGKFARPSAAAGVEQIVIGHELVGIGNNYVTFGKSSGSDRVYNLFTSNASWTRASDVRWKKDIQTNTDLGLDFINDLRTVTYKWKAPSELDPSLPDYDADKTEADYTNKMYGFIAQEVKQVLDDHNITDFAGWHVTEENHAMQGISYEMFVMPLVKAVQELTAKNTALEARVAALESA